MHLLSHGRREREAIRLAPGTLLQCSHPCSNTLRKLIHSYKETADDAISNACRIDRWSMGNGLLCGDRLDHSVRLVLQPALNRRTRQPVRREGTRPANFASKDTHTGPMVG